MREITVLSGKGGTGKTSVVAALATMMDGVVTVDADVDAANLGLLLHGRDGPEQEFFAGRKAVIDPDSCAGCGICAERCPSAALSMNGRSIPEVLEIACEGCGVCSLSCSNEAIAFRSNHAGNYWIRKTDVGPLVHGELGIAQDNSGKFVAALRKLARETAMENGASTVLLDGPPGIGCPAHAAVTGADAALVVTEPSRSGLHDLTRLLSLLAHFKVPAYVVVNRSTLDPEASAEILWVVERTGAHALGTIPYDPEVPAALARGELPRDAAPDVWRALERLQIQLRTIATS